MNYSEPLIHQYNNFFVFLGVGFILGFVYEAVVFVRALFSKKKFAIIIQDVSFCFLAFLVLFIAFLAFGNGVIRFNLLLSCAAGFLTFELTAGRAVKKLFGFLIKALQKTADILLKPFASLSSFALKRAKKTKAAIGCVVEKAKEKAKAKNEQEKKKMKASKEKRRKPEQKAQKPKKSEKAKPKEKKMNKNIRKRKSKSENTLEKIK